MTQTSIQGSIVYNITYIISSACKCTYYIIQPVIRVFITDL